MYHCSTILHENLLTYLAVLSYVISRAMEPDIQTNTISLADCSAYISLIMELVWFDVVTIYTISENGGLFNIVIIKNAYF